MMALLALGVASAYRGDPGVQGPNYNEDRHEAMEQAFESNDYTAWKSLKSESGRRGRVLDVVNADNFAQFAEAHEAMEEGNFARATEIRAEFGLNNGMGPKDGTGFKRGGGMGQNSGARMQQNYGSCPYTN